MIRVLVEYNELSPETFERLRKSLPLVVANYLQGAYKEKESDLVEVMFLSRHWADVTKFNFTISIFAPTVLTGDLATDTDVLSECARKIARSIHEDSPGGERDFSVRVYPFPTMGYFAV